VSCLICAEPRSSLLYCNSTRANSVVNSENGAVQSNKEDDDGQEIPDGEPLTTELEGVEEEQVNAQILGDESADGDGCTNAWQPNASIAGVYRWVEGPHDNSHVDEDGSQEYHKEEERTSGLDFAVVAENDNHYAKRYGNGEENSSSDDDTDTSARGERLVREGYVVVLEVNYVRVKNGVEGC